MKVAVIGSGIAGLGAALILDPRTDLTMFEAEDRLGGHAHTVAIDYPGPAGTAATRIEVDTGFIVYNETTYPNLTGLLAHLDVATDPAEMSFAFSAAGGVDEYGTRGLAGLFARPRNLVRPGQWRMIADLLRFYRAAPDLLADRDMAAITLGDLLARDGYGRDFVDRHLLPMGAAIWSCPPRAMLDFPADSFLRFCVNHGLLQRGGRPQWRTIRGGSRRYVEALRARLRGRIRTGAAIVSIARRADGILLRDAEGREDRFDHVVAAIPPAATLKLLGPAALPAERAVLGAFRQQDNRIVLHRDPRHMPRRRRIWSSWNYRAAATAEAAPSVTYWMNRLQTLPEARPVFATLNPIEPPDPALVFGRFDYAHPVFDRAATAAQAGIAALQGADRLWLCGAWCGYGFHEDGLAAGLAVGEALSGGARPWPVAREISPAYANAAPARAARAAA